MVLIIEHMVLILEQFNLENLAARNTTKILRLMIQRPYLSWGLTEISNELNISKSNVSRIIKVLLANNIINKQKSGRKILYKINYELELVKIMWKLYMEEMKLNITPEFKNIIDLIYDQYKDSIELFILFGSVARGLQTEKSDIDIIIVTKDQLDINKFDYLPFRFEIHRYPWEEISDPVDFVVLEALLNGITYKGDIFKIIAELNSFPKSYVIYRLEKSKEFLNKARSLESEARKYYENLAMITIGEIQSVIKRGTTASKRKIELNKIDQIIIELENSIAQQGERIWLT